MDLPAPPHDALAQPTRARLFQLLGELRRPAGTEELGERLGLHPNGVRVHLERLRDGGLVAREPTRQPRGRPRDMWTIAPNACPGGEAPSAYAELGGWLARAFPPSRAGLRRVEATGREIGRELAPERSALDAGRVHDEERMHAALVSLGFQPRREAGRSGGLTYRLCNCPYRDAVHESPEVVCALHLGITRGLLDVIAPNTRLAGFAPGSDPDRAGCRIELEGELATQGRGKLQEPE
ncbi:MAG: helix-turn-helix domain-containing protein [Solirubrobacterales bacterium]|nr:helix-turn-helix domain-containing protein [Solirubrobacterales bacterium]